MLSARPSKAYCYTFRKYRATSLFASNTSSLFIYMIQAPVPNGHFAVDDGIIDRALDPDRAEHGLRIETRANQFQPGLADQEQVGAFADFQAPDFALAAENLRAAHCRDLQQIVAARRRLAGVETMQQKADPQFFQEV